jgi:mannose-6-phosphate isomerase-like protein (cupin superfamily)
VHTGSGSKSLSQSPSGIPLAARDDYTRAVRQFIAIMFVLTGAVAHAQESQARAGMAMTVTNPQGATLPGVEVSVLGASDRGGETNDSGQISFTGIQAGTYRVRFSGPRVVSFEKEISLGAGQTATVDITLNAVPPPPEPPPSQAPLAPPVGPAGAPGVVSLVDLIEQQLISDSQPRRDTLVSCSGNTRSTLVQLNQNQPQRLYDTAEVSYYVIAGEGAARTGGADTSLEAGNFVSIPRGTAHVLARKGRRPLILLATVSGTPCEVAR